MYRAGLLYRRALLELVTRGGRERSVDSGEESMRLQRHDAGRYTRAISQAVPWVSMGARIFEWAPC